MTIRPNLGDRYIGLATDRVGNTWELYQQSNNLFVGTIIEEDNPFSVPEWFVITKGVLEVM